MVGRSAGGCGRAEGDRRGVGAGPAVRGRGGCPCDLRGAGRPFPAGARRFGSGDVRGGYGIDGPEQRRVRRALRDGTPLRPGDRDRALAQVRRSRFRATPGGRSVRDRYVNVAVLAYVLATGLLGAPSLTSPTFGFSDLWTVAALGVAGVVVAAVGGCRVVLVCLPCGGARVASVGGSRCWITTRSPIRPRYLHAPQGACRDLPWGVARRAPPQPLSPWASEGGQRSVHSSAGRRGRRDGSKPGVSPAELSGEAGSSSSARRMQRRPGVRHHPTRPARASPLASGRSAGLTCGASSARREGDRRAARPGPAGRCHRLRRATAEGVDAPAWCESWCELESTAARDASPATVAATVVAGRGCSRRRRTAF